MSRPCFCALRRAESGALVTRVDSLLAGHRVRQRHCSRAWIPPSTPAPPSSVYETGSRGGACSVERRVYVNYESLYKTATARRWLPLRIKLLAQQVLKRGRQGGAKTDRGRRGPEARGPTEDYTSALGGLPRGEWRLRPEASICAPRGGIERIACAAPTAGGKGRRNKHEHAKVPWGFPPGAPL